VGVFHQHATGLAFDPPNSPRTVAQQHDVAGIALDGKVFVECANNNSFGLGNHRKQRSFGDGAAAGDCRQPRSAPRPQLAIDAVAMDVRAITSTPRSDALGEHFQNCLVSLARRLR
jgi:hypothetical protein